MNASSSILVIMPIMILVALFTGIGLPFLAVSRSGCSHAAGRLACAAVLTRVSTAGPKARPPNSATNNAASLEYLYVPCTRIRHHDYSAETRRWVQQVPVDKETARWIYYASDSWDRNNAVVSPGRISRQKFEADTRCRHGYPAGVIPVPSDRHRPGSTDRLFYATRKAAEADLERAGRERTASVAPPIKELRRAADAHPGPWRHGRAIHRGAPPVPDGAPAAMRLVMVARSWLRPWI